MAAHQREPRQAEGERQPLQQTKPHVWMRGMEVHPHPDRGGMDDQDEQREEQQPLGSEPYHPEQVNHQDDHQKHTSRSGVGRVHRIDHNERGGGHLLHRKARVGRRLVDPEAKHHIKRHHQGHDGGRDLGERPKRQGPAQIAAEGQRDHQQRGDRGQ
jgi:hypothetical protein